MSNPFLTLPAFDQSAQSQIDFFDGIKTIINQLEATTPIIIEQTTFPTQVQMETLYLAGGVGRTLPVPTSQEFIWTNQGIVQGEYRTIDDLVSNVNDTGLNPINGTAGMQYLMANGDIVASVLTKVDGTVTTNLVVVGRRLGTITAFPIVTAVSTQFSASPDGTKIAFTKLDGGGKKQIYTAPYPALTPVTQLTTSTLGADNPHWVGTTILYVDFVSTTYVIKAMNDNGTSQTTVFNTGITSGQPYVQLSPDRTKVIYTVANGTKRDVYKVSISGTGNVKYIDSASSTDNPYDEMYSGMIPSWHPSGNYIYYGRRRKNINTNVSEQWFLQRITAPDSVHSLTDSYLQSNALSSWYNKNLVSVSNFNNQADEDARLYVPTFSNFILGGQVIITGLTLQGSSVIQNYPILMIASQADGYTSTGKIYKTSQYVPDRNDFELIRTDVVAGGETTFSLSKAEIKDFTHIYMVMQGAMITGGAITIKISFNEDTTAGNYQNTNVLATTVLVRAYQTFGDDAISIRGGGAATVDSFAATIFMMEIDAADAFKNVLSQIVYTNSAAAFAIANYFSGELLSVWKSIAPVESIRIVTSAALAAGTIFSYYGLRGQPRNEKDI